MARLTATIDAFRAIAEPRRRQLLGALTRPDAAGWRRGGGWGNGDGRSGEEGRDVSWLVEELGWPQPQVSKHLGVLREVGLVSVARKGKIGRAHV